MTRRIWLAPLVASALLAACSPSAPPGVDRDELDAAIGQSIGDPTTCVLIAEAKSGKLLYRYNSPSACGKKYPACDRPGATTVGKLLEATVADGNPRRLSCDTLADGSRGVGWASGPVAGKPLVYAAVMEGDRVFPGVMMADRLEGAFRRAKASKPSE